MRCHRPRGAGLRSANLQFRNSFFIFPSTYPSLQKEEWEPRINTDLHGSDGEPEKEKSPKAFAAIL